MGHFLHGKSEQRRRSSHATRTMSSSSSSTSAGVSSSRAAQPQNLTAEAVAALPPPGLSGPSSPVFSPQRMDSDKASSFAEQDIRYLAFLSSSMQSIGSSAARRPLGRQSNSSGGSSSGERQLCVLDLNQIHPGCDISKSLLPLLRLPPRSNNSNNNTSSFMNHRRNDGTTSTSTSSNLTNDSVSLEERLRRERQRLHSSGGATQFSWCWTTNSDKNKKNLRVLVPLRGNVYVQDGIASDAKEPLRLVYDRSVLQQRLFGKNVKTSGPVVGRDASAIDPQLSPDGTMVAFVVAGDIYVLGLDGATLSENHPGVPVRLTFGALEDAQEEDSCITHGLADFVAQEEMDRYRGFWWDPDSKGILFTRVDESNVPQYRITHQGRDGSAEDAPYEDHRYPFAGKDNPKVQLGYVRVDKASILGHESSNRRTNDDMTDEDSKVLNYLLDSSNDMDEDGQSHDMSLSDTSTSLADEVARENWARTKWLDPPHEAQEYLARVSWLPDGSACAQWQNRTQSTLVLVRIDLTTGKTRTLLTERSDVWINLNHMMRVLPQPIHPDDCFPTLERHRLPNPLPPGSFSFFFASERTGYTHLYLYTYAPGYNGERAVLLRTVSGGDWIVESIVGVDLESDAVYITGTHDSPLERHLFALPITNRGGRNIVENGRDESSTGRDLSDEKHSEGDNSSHHHGGGVRRSLKHVMNAFSGKPSSVRKNSSSSSTMDATSDGVPIPDPVRLTSEPGMHSVVMDHDCRIYVDTSSDLDRPTSVKLFVLPKTGPFVPIPTNGARGRKSPRKQVDSLESKRTERTSVAKFLCVLYDAAQDDKATSSFLPSSIVPDSIGTNHDWLSNLPPPEMLSFPTSDGTETLHAALYKPDATIHGPGPYPLVCAVYGGPHVQRVNRSWAQSADMRAQLLRSLGFAVVKCDNRGSSRRGLSFECAIRKRLGRLEVLDQVTTVRHLTMRGIVDPNRVGIYGWSYGGYLSAMCLCRAPDVFHVAVAGAPVTSWDGYDTHYTERYMGLPSENPGGYREAAVFEHVPNMRGKLMIVHGLIDENVHFRHTARLINRLIAAGKDYDLLIFPDERHSPRRLRDRIYMEQKISDYFLRNLMGSTVGLASNSAQHFVDGTSTSILASSSRANSSSNSNAMRTMAGHL